MKTRANIVGSAPILLVKDVEKAADYYRDSLGFSYDQFYSDPPSFCILKRNQFYIMLSLANEKDIIPHYKVVPQMWNIYFWVDDVRAICEEFKDRGAIIDYHLYQKDYSCLEFGIQDIDGYDIAFGQNN